MKFVLSLVLLVSVTNNLYSQQRVRFKKLPRIVKDSIAKDASKLLDTNIVTGTVTYVEKPQSGLFHTYTYKLSIKKGKLRGVFTHYTGCTSCAALSREGQFTIQVLYCCKDAKHRPHESAKTREEMIKIQKRNKCSKIGLCIV